jgi:hypothetical protein
MPRFDGTGPWGEGPMTGGGFGNCSPIGAGYRQSYGVGFGRGRGSRRGFGRGRGYGPGAYPPARGECAVRAFRGAYAVAPGDEIEMLRNEANGLKADLDAITRRIGELESQSSE